MYEFKLADVGEGIHEVEIARWLVKVGDTITRDQTVVEIETDKALVEIPAPVAGKIVEIRAAVGTLAHIGDVLVVIQQTEKAAQPTPPAASSNGAARATAPASNVTKPGIAGPGKRVLAAPAVRKLALTLDIDLSQVSGNGPAGRVLPGDVKQFAAQQATAKQATTKQAPRPTTAPTPVAAPPPPVTPVRSGEELTERRPLRGLRRRIAQRMQAAWRVPHVTNFEEVDATHLLATHKSLREDAERHGVRLTFLPIIIKITAQVLKAHPYLNATIDMDNEEILLHRHYHIGVATAIKDGLLVPVVRHADRLNVLQIATEVNRLAEGARQRKLPPNDLTGSTFTITNFGSFGSQVGTPIINPPEVAILGTGRITDKPVVVDGAVVVRPIMPLVLSYDHRLIDGAVAGAFLAHLKTLLERPDKLLLELV